MKKTAKILTASFCILAFTVCQSRANLKNPYHANGYEQFSFIPSKRSKQPALRPSFCWRAAVVWPFPRRPIHHWLHTGGFHCRCRKPSIAPLLAIKPPRFANRRSPICESLNHHHRPVLFFAPVAIGPNNIPIIHRIRFTGAVVDGGPTIFPAARLFLENWVDFP